MPLQTGAQDKFYYNSATDATPTWVEIGQIEDLSIDGLGQEMAELKMREAGWILNLPGLKKVDSIGFNLKSNVGNTVWDALRGFLFADPQVAKQYAVANGDIATSGTEYFKAFCFIGEFPLSQPISEVDSGDVELQLAYHEESGTAVYPSWETVA